VTPPNAPNGRSGIRVRCLVVLTLVGIASVGPAPVGAQSEGDAGAATRGVVLGAYSGAALGLIGGLSPCNRTIRGTRCARIASVLGGVVGSTSGGILSYRAPDFLNDRLQGAGLGVVVGASFGVILRFAVRQYGWQDVGATAALGAALGASPVGSGIGFGVGVTAGSLLWLVAPGVGLPEAAAISLASPSADSSTGCTVRQPQAAAPAQ
jgi:hypothetical protein